MITIIGNPFKGISNPTKIVVNPVEIIVYHLYNHIKFYQGKSSGAPPGAHPPSKPLYICIYIYYIYIRSTPRRTP